MPHSSASELLLQPDMDFLRDLRDRAGDSFLRCYQCGTCAAVCPFARESLELPRREMLLAQWGQKHLLLNDPNLWVCTTCGNCARLCPREVDIPGTIAALREIAVLESAPPQELGKAFEHTLGRGNPLGEPARTRAAWTQDAGVEVPVMAQLARPVDVLFYVECYWSYHPRGRAAARAMARTLSALGVDFAILGQEERCVGDSQRLGGETGLFEELAQRNIEVLSRYDFRLLVTPDPHAFHALRKHYPALGWQGEVMHYSQFLEEQLPRLSLHPLPDVRVTYHDPCYLGRYSGIYDPPRQILASIPGLNLIEMEHSRENSLCCGGGGGGVWNSGFTATQVSERLSERRVREAVAAGAEVLVVACPFEVSLFEDAIKATGNEGRLVVRDIVELVDASLRA